MKARWDRLSKGDVLALCGMACCVVALLAWTAGHTPDYWRGYREGYARGLKAARTDEGR